MRDFCFYANYLYDMGPFYLRNSILATLIYYDVFGLPLTLAEIYKYLINPQRFSTKKDDPVSIETTDMVNELYNMTRIGMIGRKNGFYFMPGRDELYGSRIEKDKLAARKWKKFLQVAKYLQMAPYLRAVFASGSLAANNPEPKSDFDVFVIIKAGRLYTGRLFLWLISSLLGVRRRRFEIIAPDKLCFNHYLTDDNPEFSHRSLYIAQSLANMKPVIAFGGTLEKFTALNKWTSSYCYNFRQADAYMRIRPNKIMLTLAKAGETVLNIAVGDIFEKIFRALQQRRIKNNPATYESGGRIIFNDRELEFHPRSFERTVIDNYNNSLKKFGILGVEENDSGLN